jgi:transcriptional regulator with XRE-family HTH domain
MERIEERDVTNVRFGQAMARARKRTGKTQEALARSLGCSKGHISHIECGYRRLAQVSVPEVDRELQAEGRLTRLYEELYEPHQLDWLDKLHHLQAEAELIREYHNTLVPGLLQTPEFAGAVIEAGGPWLKRAEIEERVAARMQRSKAILEMDTPHLNVVLDDMVVKRPVATPQVMLGQCKKLLQLAESQRVVLQFYPWDSRPHAGLNGPLTLLSSGTAPDVLHAESVYLGQSFDDPAAVRRYGMLFARLQANARSQSESARFLQEVMREYEHAE